MRLATFSAGAEHRVGVVDPADGVLRDVSGLLPAGTGVTELIEGWAEFGPVLVAAVAGAPVVPAERVRLCAPIPVPRRNILCLIGTGGRGIAEADAYAHVWGYTVLNDVTARDLQRDHKQWFLGKSLDTHCPMGPWAVSADEVDVEALEVSSRVNGELRQQASVRDLIFDIPTLIATLSAGMTLLPGDVIATGTPAGVGIGFNPPRFLADGDVVEMSISGLGVLRNEFREVIRCG